MHMHKALGYNIILELASIIIRLEYNTNRVRARSILRARMILSRIFIVHTLVEYSSHSS